MRAFVAIPLPEAIRAELGALCRRLQRAETRATWVRPGRMHLTLRFLAEIDAETARAYAVRLAARTRKCEPVRLAVTGTGAFPNPRRPSVLWAGVTALEGDLDALHHAAEHAARRAGLEADARKFHPHITLARIRDRRRLGRIREALAAEENFDAGAFIAERLVLFESRLSPKGPEYRPIEEFALS